MKALCMYILTAGSFTVALKLHLVLPKLTLVSAASVFERLKGAKAIMFKTVPHEKYCKIPVVSACSVINK